jgi:hypothetical protein
MNPILIFKNDVAIEQEKRAIQTQKNHFQTLVDQYNDLKIGDELKGKDLLKLYENPKAYIVDQVTKGQVLKIGNLEISKNKAFDMLELPNSVYKLIESIEFEKDQRNNQFYQQHLNSFAVVNNCVEYCDKYNEWLENKHSIVISDEETQKVWEQLNLVSKNLNELRKLTVKFNKKLDLEQLETALTFKDPSQNQPNDFENKANPMFIKSLIRA